MNGKVSWNENAIEMGNTYKSLAKEKFINECPQCGEIFNLFASNRVSCRCYKYDVVS